MEVPAPEGAWSGCGEPEEEDRAGKRGSLETPPRASLATAPSPLQPQLLLEPDPAASPSRPAPLPTSPDPPAAGARPTRRETTQVARSKQALRAKNERESEPQSREVRKPRPGLPQPRRALLREAAVATGRPALRTCWTRRTAAPAARAARTRRSGKRAPARSIPSARSAPAHAHTHTHTHTRAPARQGEVVPAPAPRAALSRVQRPYRRRARPAPRPHPSGAALHLTTRTPAKNLLPRPRPRRARSSCRRAPRREQGAREGPGETRRERGLYLSPGVREDGWQREGDQGEVTESSLRRDALEIRNRTGDETEVFKLVWWKSHKAGTGSENNTVCQRLRAFLFSLQQVSQQIIQSLEPEAHFQELTS
ncbi:uncharacterized protein LOC107400298 [Peromyscus maniculatus bairdii]|uniref:uncharacterized protein LOC107400298 n=1 Tax=Peromyscus maniculatus bairdii TaxID=230844 RepID=UPI003FCF3E63